MKLVKPYIFLAILTTVFQYSTAQSSVKRNQPFSSDSLINYCLSLKGIPYKWAGSDVTGFDCSGFISYVFKHFNVDVGHSTTYLATLGKEVSIEEAQPGDIFIFSGTDTSKKVPGHAGIIISKKGEPLQFMHSSSSKKHWGVINTLFYNGYYPTRFLEIRRVAVFD